MQQKNIPEFTSEGEKPKGYTTVIRKLDNGQEIEWNNCFYDNGWYDKSGCYIPNVIKWKKTMVAEPKVLTIDEVSEDFIENTLHFYFNMSETKRMANLLKKAFIEGAKWQSEQK